MARCPARQSRDSSGECKHGVLILVRVAACIPEAYWCVVFKNTGAGLRSRIALCARRVSARRDLRPALQQFRSVNLGVALFLQVVSGFGRTKMRAPVGTNASERRVELLGRRLVSSDDTGQD